MGRVPKGIGWQLNIVKTAGNRTEIEQIKSITDVRHKIIHQNELQTSAGERHLAAHFKHIILCATIESANFHAEYSRRRLRVVSCDGKYTGTVAGRNRRTGVHQVAENLTASSNRTAGAQDRSATGFHHVVNFQRAAARFGQVK